LAPERPLVLTPLRPRDQRRHQTLPLPLSRPSLQPQDQSSLRLLLFVPPRLLLMPPRLRPARHPLMPSAQAPPLPQVQALHLHPPQPRVPALLRPLPQSPLQPPLRPTLLLADLASVRSSPGLSRSPLLDPQVAQVPGRCRVLD